MTDRTAIEKIKALRSDAERLANLHADYDERYAADSRCDKKGFGFGEDNRFAAFKVSTSFDSYAGYYGNSNCSRILSLADSEAAQVFVRRALNVLQREIFATAAKLMRDEAATMTAAAEGELRAMQEMLDAAKAAA